MSNTSLRGHTVHPDTPPRPPHTKWGVAVLIGVGAAAAVALIVIAFLWPTKALTAQNLPVSISGSPAVVSAFETAVDEHSPGTFDWVKADDRSDAVHQIKTRETYGAIVLPAAQGQLPEVLTAPAGSSIATQLLGVMAGQLQAQVTAQVTAAGGNPAGAVVKTTAVVPLSSDDPTGAGLTASAFPMMMGGMIGGILISLLVVGPVRRLAALAGLAVAVGIGIPLILQTWFGFLQGDFWLNAAAIGLSVLATASFIVGCTSLIGRAGIAIGAVVTMLVGNPLSAAAVPVQFVPTPWGEIGQFMVPGASNWLVRSLSYFPDADVSKQWWILGTWAAVGILLTIVGHFRSQEPVHVPDATLEHEPEHAAGAAAPALNPA
ncbi:hypothetical protein [Microbacterium mangrovi]|uniref:hypothetical protein n=1 Tax=Microbacterium mangrovi TaxID=1348253 RepID=UPI000690CE3C|nr:hypothetical protein [Microbacterium mangrovi]